jgi:hypothetical protein
MKATKQEHDKHAADYADEFNQPEKAPREVSEDEAFGLSEPAAGEGAAAEGSPAEEAAESPAEAAAEQEAAPGGEEAPGEAAPEGEAATEPAAEGEAAASPVDQEQRLKSWEGRLKARQAELDAREAAMGSSSVNDEQGSEPMDEEGAGGEGGEEGDEGGAGGDDPAAVLADDFGPDFVEQLTKLIKQVAAGCGGGADPRVDQVIEALQNERLNNHFNAIAATHADFMDVVESPEFAAWKGEQPDQDRLQQVIDGGSARQIIDMLNGFKNSTKKADNPDYHGNEDALDAAEGVRSSALSLPQEPAASDDFAKAWNEA